MVVVIMGGGGADEKGSTTEKGALSLINSDFYFNLINPNGWSIAKLSLQSLQRSENHKEIDGLQGLQRSTVQQVQPFRGLVYSEKMPFWGC